MKKIAKILFLCGIIVFTAFGCEKNEELDSNKNNLIDTWIEKSPDLYDGISDTIVFTDKFYIEKHFYFNGWKYNYSNDSVTFSKADNNKRFSLIFIGANEIVINNFLDRSVTSQVKNIHFIKLN